jgi:hypothetical protein
MIGIAKRQWPQQDTVDQTKDGCVCADAQRECHDRDQSDRGLLQQNACTITKIQ